MPGVLREQPTAAPVVEATNATVEKCSSTNVNVEKQLLAYVSGIEAITGTIQELDEAVQQMRPRSCQEVPSLEVFKPTRTTTTTTLAPITDPGEIAVTTTMATTELPAEAASSTGASNAVSTELPEATKSLSDNLDTSKGEQEATTHMVEEIFTRSPPLWSSSSSSSDNYYYQRERRQAVAATATTTTSTTTNETPYFGMPTTSPSTGSPVIQDQSGEDLTKASNDLKALRKDLSSTAEWLRQTNHTVHSAMLRALQAYVSSIERRIDHQRQLFAQTRSAALKTKVAAIKEKVSNLMERLKALIPFKSNGVISRDDHVASNTVTTPTTTVSYPTTMVTSISTPATNVGVNNNNNNMI